MGINSAPNPRPTMATRIFLSLAMAISPWAILGLVRLGQSRQNAHTLSFFLCAFAPPREINFLCEDYAGSKIIGSRIKCKQVLARFPEESRARRKRIVS